jgi:hypothetical protein
MVALDFALQPKRERGVMDACFTSHVHLFDVVLGQRLKHLRANVFLW